MSAEDPFLKYELQTLAKKKNKPRGLVVLVAMIVGLVIGVSLPDMDTNDGSTMLGHTKTRLYVQHNVVGRQVSP